MTCEVCKKPLRARQGRFCSRDCQYTDGQPWRRNEVLALLRETSDQWMTLSDMAYWIYGDDSLSARANLRVQVYRLTLLGYPVERRKATWVWSMSVQIAYRLVEQASEAAA